MSKTITQLPATAAALATDLFEKVDGTSGDSEKVTGTQLATMVAAVIVASGFVGGSVLQGVGAPVAAPSDPAAPSLYTDSSDGTLYFWNITAQAWQ